MGYLFFLHKKKNLFKVIILFFTIGAIGDVYASESIAECDFDPDNEENRSCDGLKLSEIRYEIDNIFDISDPEENKLLFRLANKLHIVTRKRVIENQLLFKKGDAFSTQKIIESERLLRSKRYIQEAKIDAFNNADGEMVVDVKTKDTWTLSSGVSFGRKGGKNSGGFGLEEANFLGMGNKISYSQQTDVDRSQDILEFYDPHFLGSHWIFNSMLSDSTDGYFKSISINQPFYSLDARHTYGVDVSDGKQETTMYRLGQPVDSFIHERQYSNIFWGGSEGLKNGWAKRWSAGFRYDENEFFVSSEYPQSNIRPLDRILAYPWIKYEWLENNFEETSNFQRIGVIEDRYFGMHVQVSLGIASENFGSDRDAEILFLSVSKGYKYNSEHMAFIETSASARHEQKNIVNSSLSTLLRYYWHQSPRWVFYTSVRGDYAHKLDNNEQLLLGGDNGLRGYPLRYQSGERRVILNVEQRYFSDLYLFRLFHIGGAVFFDAGRAWKDRLYGSQDLGVLRDVGFGLRIGSSRSHHGNVLHVDLAFPLNGSALIDKMQLVVELKNEF